MCSGLLKSFISSLVMKLDFILQLSSKSTLPFEGLQHMQQCQVKILFYFIVFFLEAKLLFKTKSIKHVKCNLFLITVWNCDGMVVLHLIRSHVHPSVFLILVFFDNGKLKYLKPRKNWGKAIFLSTWVFLSSATFYRL